MLQDAEAFSGYSIANIEDAKSFYGKMLGLRLEEQAAPMAMLTIKLANGTDVLMYQKDTHAPATFTVLNFQVADIDKVVDQLAEKGVEMQVYEGMHADGRGIHDAGNHRVAWFADPSGNVLSVMQL